MYHNVSQSIIMSHRPDRSNCQHIEKHEQKRLVSPALAEAFQEAAHPFAASAAGAPTVSKRKLRRFCNRRRHGLRTAPSRGLTNADHTDHNVQQVDGYQQSIRIGTVKFESGVSNDEADTERRQIAERLKHSEESASRPALRCWDELRQHGREDGGCAIVAQDIKRKGRRKHPKTASNHHQPEPQTAAKLADEYERSSPSPSAPKGVRHCTEDWTRESHEVDNGLQFCRVRKLGVKNKIKSK